MKPDLDIGAIVFELKQLKTREKKLWDICKEILDVLPEKQFNLKCDLVCACADLSSKNLLNLFKGIS